MPRLHKLQELITHIPATTPPGLQAKARAALHMICGDATAGSGPMDEDDRLVGSVLQDVLGMAL